MPILWRNQQHWITECIHGGNISKLDRPDKKSIVKLRKELDMIYGYPEICEKLYDNDNIKMRWIREYFVSRDSVRWKANMSRMIYSREPTTKKWRTGRLQKFLKTDILRSIGKQCAVYYLKILCFVQKYSLLLLLSNSQANNSQPLSILWTILPLYRYVFVAFVQIKKILL